MPSRQISACLHSWTRNFTIQRTKKKKMKRVARIRDDPQAIFYFFSARTKRTRLVPTVSVLTRRMLPRRFPLAATTTKRRNHQPRPVQRMLSASADFEAAQTRVCYNTRQERNRSRVLRASKKLQIPIYDSASCK